MREALLISGSPNCGQHVVLETGGAACQEIADGTFFQEREGQHTFMMWLKNNTLCVASVTLSLCRNVSVMAHI